MEFDNIKAYLKQILAEADEGETKKQGDNMTSEQAQHEAFKQLWKQLVRNNQRLTPSQKQQACDNIDRLTFEADVIEDFLKRCGLLRG